MLSVATVKRNKLFKLYGHVTVLKSLEPFVASIKGHWALMRSSHRLSAFVVPGKSLPARRYLHQHLALDLNPVDKRRIIIRHQDRMAQIANDIDRVDTSRNMVLWRRQADGNSCSIELRLNERPYAEGEATLSFLMNGDVVYRISFMISPGNIFGRHAEDGIFVGRVQGVFQGLNHIKCCAHICEGVAPLHLLLTALQEICAAAGAQHLFGVSSDKHVYSSADGASFAFDYDEFWSGVGASKNERGYFHTAMPLPCKPLSEIAGHHRRRARRRREFRLGVANDIASALTFPKVAVGAR